jgi:hypothetical protein
MDSMDHKIGHRCSPLGSTNHIVHPPPAAEGTTPIDPLPILSSVRKLPPILILLAAAIPACTAPTPTPPQALPPRTSPAIIAPARPAFEPWSFQGTPGKLFRTSSYRLFTTETDALLLAALPAFLESSLDRYTTEFGPLPLPPMSLDTFLMINRPQWTRLTRQLMGDHAAPYLLIERGGFSSGGRALLWSIGRADTLAIAAHEGWHQYTQRTFKDELPTWLEEGIAVYFEGMIIEHARPLSPRPAPWANNERYEQLRSAANRGQLAPLSELLTSRPEALIHVGADPTLTYYAQVWALIHFLREHDGGRHRAALHQLLLDAAEGRLATPVAQSHHTADASAHLFRTYFDDDLARADREFSHFVMSILDPAARANITRGQSPLQ